MAVVKGDEFVYGVVGQQNLLELAVDLVSSLVVVLCGDLVELSTLERERETEKERVRKREREYERDRDRV